MDKEKRKKLIAIIIASLIALPACSNKEEEVSKIDNSKKELAKEIGLEEEEVTNEINRALAEEKIIVDDATAISYFEINNEEIKEHANENEDEEFREKVKDHLKTTVDFVFNDKPINGVKFSSLKEETKEKIVETLEDTNYVLEESGLKDISIEYGKEAKVWTLKAFKEATIITKIGLKELLDKKTYDKLENAIDEGKERINNAKDEIESYLKK